MARSASFRQPEWGEDSHSLAYELLHEESGEHLLVMLNAYWEPLVFELPPPAPGRRWLLLVDTANESPEDFCDPPVPLASEQEKYACQARSTVVLVSAPQEK